MESLRKQRLFLTPRSSYSRHTASQSGFSGLKSGCSILTYCRNRVLYNQSETLQLTSEGSPNDSTLAFCLMGKLKALCKRDEQLKVAKYVVRIIYGL